MPVLLGRGLVPAPSLCVLFLAQVPDPADVSRLSSRGLLDVDILGIADIGHPETLNPLTTLAILLCVSR